MTETLPPPVPAEPTGRDVRRLRERLGETQAEFARRFRVPAGRETLSRHSICKLEHCDTLASGMSARVRDVMEAAHREMALDPGPAPTTTATTTDEGDGRG